MFTGWNILVAAAIDDAHRCSSSGSSASAVDNIGTSRMHSIPLRANYSVIFYEDFVSVSRRDALIRRFEDQTGVMLPKSAWEFKRSVADAIKFSQNRSSYARKCFAQVRRCFTRRCCWGTGNIHSGGLQRRDYVAKMIEPGFQCVARVLMPNVVDLYRRARKGDSHTSTANNNVEANCLIAINSALPSVVRNCKPLLRFVSVWNNRNETAMA
jgi:hypothetical protein